MHRVLIVDASDFQRRFISVDLTPNPMPLLSDLGEKARIEAAASDTVIYSDGDDDPIVLKSNSLNLGPYPWKRLESVLKGTYTAKKAERSRSGKLEHGPMA